MRRARVVSWSVRRIPRLTLVLLLVGLSAAASAHAYAQEEAAPVDEWLGPPPGFAAQTWDRLCSGLAVKTEVAGRAIFLGPRDRGDGDTHPWMEATAKRLRRRSPRTGFGVRSQSTIRARGTGGDPSMGRIRMPELEELTIPAAITIVGPTSRNVRGPPEALASAVPTLKDSMRWRGSPLDAASRAARAARAARARSSRVAA